MFDTIYGFGFRYVLWNGHEWMLLAFYFLMIELIYIVLSGSPWERYRELLQKHHTGTVVLISLVFGVCLYLHQFLLLTLLLTLTPTIYYFTYLPITRWDTRLVCQLDFESQRNISRRDILKEDHDQQKRDHLACSTYQQILKSHAR